MRVVFTPKQINDWKRYEKVRLGGRWNMWFPQARAATGLTQDEYLFVMQNFEALRDAAAIGEAK